MSYESYCYHHRISHSKKKKEYEACYKALESESKLNIDDLKIVDTLSNKIQLALFSDLPETAQASNELEALFHRNGLHDQWVIVSQLNSEISFHAIKACEADGEYDDGKSVSSEVRLMVEEEDDIPTDPEGCDSEAKSVEGADEQDSSIAAVLPKEILEAGPEGCDSETKSVEGDDEQDSVRSSIHPPASSSKMSNRTRLCHIVSNLLCENQDCKIQ